MKKTPVILAILVCLAGGGAFAWQSLSPQEVALGKVKGNPAAYLGKVKVTGKVGRVDPARGLLEMVDEKACCNLVLALPFTAEQKTTLGADTLYAGTLPQPGQPLRVLGRKKSAEDTAANE